MPGVHRLRHSRDQVYMLIPRRTLDWWTTHGFGSRSVEVYDNPDGSLTIKPIPVESRESDALAQPA